MEIFFSEWNGYLAHIEKTGREKQSLSVGLVDSPSVGNGGNANNKIKSPSAGFGRDMPKGVAFNEEQESQLRKLREEATKAKRS